MTGRPETLEAALAWLAEQEHGADVKFQSFVEGSRGIDVKAFDGKWTRIIHSGDIPAAIVSAVGDVWEQVHGKGEA